MSEELRQLGSKALFVGANAEVCMPIRVASRRAVEGGEEIPCLFIHFVVWRKGRWPARERLARLEATQEVLLFAVEKVNDTLRR